MSVYIVGAVLVVAVLVVAVVVIAAIRQAKRKKEQRAHEVKFAQEKADFELAESGDEEALLRWAGDDKYGWYYAHIVSEYKPEVKAMHIKAQKHVLFKRYANRMRNATSELDSARTPIDQLKALANRVRVLAEAKYKGVGDELEEKLGVTLVASLQELNNLFADCCTTAVASGSQEGFIDLQVAVDKEFRLLEGVIYPYEWRYLVTLWMESPSPHDFGGYHRSEWPNRANILIAAAAALRGQDLVMGALILAYAKRNSACRQELGNLREELAKMVEELRALKLREKSKRA